MTLAIRMRGDIDKIRLPGDFENFTLQVNLAAAKGMEYVILQNENGNMMALNQKNILTVEDLGDDSDAGMVG